MSDNFVAEFGQEGYAFLELANKEVYGEATEVRVACGLLISEIVSKIFWEAQEEHVFGGWSGMLLHSWGVKVEASINVFGKMKWNSIVETRNSGWLVELQGLFINFLWNFLVISQIFALCQMSLD